MDALKIEKKKQVLTQAYTTDKSLLTSSYLVALQIARWKRKTKKLFILVKNLLAGHSGHAV
jgi:hypothetical protein